MDFTVDGEVLRNGKKQWKSLVIHNVQTKDQAIVEAESRIPNLRVMTAEPMEMDLDALGAEHDLVEDDDFESVPDESLDWKEDRGDFVD